MLPLVILGLFNALYQNHMHSNLKSYLRIITLFAGLRVLTRPGQSLLGERVKFDEISGEIFKEEITDGSIVRMQDDLVIGGVIQKEAAHNYIRVFHQLYLVNLKVEPTKTNIFPQSCNIAGWVWQTGGYLGESPHSKNTPKH